MGARIKRGVKKRPKTTTNGLKVVAQVYAINKRKYFVVAKSRDCYVVERITKTGKTAKRQIRQLWDRDWPTAGQAKDAIRRWDMV